MIIEPTDVQKVAKGRTAALVLVFHSALLSFLLCGCSGSPKRTPEQKNLQAVELNGPVQLVMKSAVGRIERVKYFSAAKTATYTSGNINKTKDESVEFTSETQTSHIGANGQISQNLKVIHKDGLQDLRSYAMPEPGEVIEMVYSPRGEILKAGDYPQGSLFFVPSVSLPDRPIVVGDTWPMKARWMSLDQGLPFELDMVTIFKGAWKCGSDICVDLEVSGDVRLLGEFTTAAEFGSRWLGRIYFAINSGTTVWSSIKSEEKFSIETVRTESKTCIQSILAEPPTLAPSGLPALACEP